MVEPQAANKSGAVIKPVNEPNNSQFTVKLENDLGVTATIDVTEFTSGKDTWGDNEHDYITTELNYMGGEWPINMSVKSVDFANSRFVIETQEQKQFVLIPWANAVKNTQ